MIPEVKKILYVSDLADGSRPAFRMAVSQAKQYDAEIVFLHVLEPISDSARIAFQSALSDSEFKKIRTQGVSHLKETMAARIENFYQAELDGMQWRPQVTPVLLEGTIDSTIVQTAAQQGVDLIVMGTRTHSATKQFFMGSTANKVMHHTAIPVMVVPLH